jgi:biopolymer transport protein ExbB
MKRVSTVLLLLSLLPGFVSPIVTVAQEQSAPPQITNLNELLQTVREQQREQRERNAQREQRFLRDKQEQQALLAKARADFERTKNENQPLAAVTESNTAQIKLLQEQLQAESLELGDLAATFREFSGDFSAVLQDSMISAQFPERREKMQILAAADTLPSIDDIQSLWVLLQEEMTEAARITRFDSQVVHSDGTASARPVLRIGTFSAFSEGDFLRFVPETGELLVLSRQPASRYRNAAREFALHPGEITAITVDPSRGNLLGMLSYTPNLRERIEQGGMIGYITIALGIFGLAIAAWRGLYLGVQYLRIRKQLLHLASPRATNPLGRVLQSVQGVDLNDDELLQLKLDEAVLAELPALERGNNVLKLLAATAPLLGLLGTVTGMILTFQAISLFGSGDPKLMAGGISQALVTTVIGLVVAIPLLFCHSVIAYLSRTMVQRLDEQCAGVLARSAEQRERPR